MDKVSSQLKGNFPRPEREMMNTPRRRWSKNSIHVYFVRSKLNLFQFMTNPILRMQTVKQMRMLCVCVYVEW